MFKRKKFFSKETNDVSKKNFQNRYKSQMSLNTVNKGILLTVPQRTEVKAQLVANMYMLKRKYELKFLMLELEEIKTFDNIYKIKDDAEILYD